MKAESGDIPPRPYHFEHAVAAIYEAAASAYWPQYFEQWTLILLDAGFQEEEIYSAVDQAKRNLHEKAQAQENIGVTDILELAALITRYFQALEKLDSLPGGSDTPQ